MSEELDEAINRLKELSLESRSIAIDYINTAHKLESKKLKDKTCNKKKTLYSPSGTVFADSLKQHLHIGDRIKLETPGKKEGIYFYKGDEGIFVGTEDSWALVYPDKFVGKFSNITIKRLPHNLTKLH